MIDKFIDWLIDVIDRQWLAVKAVQGYVFYVVGLLSWLVIVSSCTAGIRSGGVMP